MTHCANITLMANAYSPHVAHWVDVMERNSILPVVFTVHDDGVGRKVDVPVKVYMKWAGWLPIILRYVLAGLYIRFFMGKARRPSLVHAHNTSGYGLMAYLSGVPYILTTYGSEIFLAGQKGWLYRASIKLILSNAIRITGTTEAMARSLIHDFGVPEEKITIFSLGLVGPFAYSEESRQRTRTSLDIHDDDTPIFFANRRIHPHYNVIPLVRAFCTLWDKQRKGLLILLEGDSDKQYMKCVEREASGCSGIKIIRGFIDQHQLCAYLCASDFTVSIPNSDQLSSSILEAAACMNVPIMSDIGAYSELLRVEGCIRLGNLDERSIANELSRLFGLSQSEILAAKASFYKYCAKKYGRQSVDSHVRSLYEMSRASIG